ncbi:uncharacterized protein LOC121999286 [Zingiber officinale]|uniref:Uncharacterized protein n=1 Tax=Zingiber officinale TaxID=94328 RepID=A0A8J5KVH4_ZINOF|nr:uncharacterized protein LOC121999286 [Zingiber officinale]KAG6492258.1 hypothetical protein ZIOFF_047210 [Zingiber officinale]
MALPFLPMDLMEALHNRWQCIVYAVAWTILIIITVALAALSPELAFIWAVSPTSAFMQACGAGTVRLPMEGSPNLAVCLPSIRFDRSNIDIVVPPLFAVLVVMSSALVVRAIGLWEAEEEQRIN